VGAVACERHGTHPGVLCCDHVGEAVASSRPFLSFDNYRVDVVIDGAEPLNHLLCNKCAERFALSPRELIPKAVWADASRFPYVWPVCAGCFLEWRARMDEHG
jgi:hypothetical protein